MNPLGALALLALAFGGSGKRSSPPVPKGETEAQRHARVAKQIAAESSDIIHGKRDAYSDDPELVNVVKKVDETRSSSSSTAPVVKPLDESASVVDEPDADEALQLAVREAVEAADRAARDAEARGVVEPAPVVNDDDDDESAQQMIPGPPSPPPEQVVEDIAEVTSVPAPVAEPTPAPSQIPAGYDPDGARRMAPSLARHLKNCGKTDAERRSNYDRRLVETFQTKAGIPADRHYGGATWGALVHYGGKDAPKAVFPPLAMVAYKPPA